MLSLPAFLHLIVVTCFMSFRPCRIHNLWETTSVSVTHSAPGRNSDWDTQTSSRKCVEEWRNEWEWDPGPSSLSLHLCPVTTWHRCKGARSPLPRNHQVTTVFMAVLMVIGRVTPDSFNSYLALLGMILLRWRSGWCLLLTVPTLSSVWQSWEEEWWSK